MNYQKQERRTKMLVFNSVLSL